MRARPTDTPLLSRRDVLRFAAGAAGAALLAACGDTAVAPAPTAANTAAPPAAPTMATLATMAGGAAASPAAPASTAANPSTASAAAVFNLPDSGAKLPTDKVTFRWVDSGDNKAVFMRQYVPAYQKARPNVTITYDPLPWNEIAKVVPLGVQNGNAPDVFQIPLNFTAAQAVQQGWASPLNDVIPNFEAWKKNFPPNTFIEGVTDFGGKTYVVGFTKPVGYDTLLLYNVAQLQQAGLDPAAKSLTWDEFRAAAKKLTQQGAGKYYGLIFEGAQVNRFEAFVRNLSRLAGASVIVSGGFDINGKTGDLAYTSDPYLAAIDLLLGLKSDGSIFPGSINLNAPMARSQMPSGVASMILQGPWNIPQWQRENPDFTFGVASQPVPNGGIAGSLTIGPGPNNQLYVFARSQNKAVAGDILAYLGTVEGQSNWGKLVGAGDPPIFPQALAALKSDPLARKSFDLADQQVRLGPSPVVRNPDIALVNLEQKSVSPDFGTTVQGLFTGQLRDAKAAMKDLQDRANAELDRAIKAAQGKGAKVARDDYKFPNWDPMKDYGEAEYAAIKK